LGLDATQKKNGDSGIPFANGERGNRSQAIERRRNSRTTKKEKREVLRGRKGLTSAEREPFEGKGGKGLQRIKVMLS